MSGCFLPCRVRSRRNRRSARKLYRATNRLSSRTNQPLVCWTPETVMTSDCHCRIFMTACQEPCAASGRQYASCPPLSQVPTIGLLRSSPSKRQRGFGARKIVSGRCTSNSRSAARIFQLSWRKSKAAVQNSGSSGLSAAACGRQYAVGFLRRVSLIVGPANVCKCFNRIYISLGLTGAAVCLPL